MDEPTLTVASAAGATAPISGGFGESFRDLMNGNLSTGVSGLLLKVVVPAGVALLLIVVAYFMARMVARWTAGFVCRRVDQTLGKFVGKLTFYAIMSLVGLSVLQTADVDVTGFVALIAAAGFAIGLAFQGTLSNFASGILLLVFRPFRVGDLINAAGVIGKVNEIDLFTTTLDTPDNRRLIIPNSSISGATIENITFHKHRRVDVPVGVAYAASLDETRRVLTACAESIGDKLVRGEGRGYQILLMNLGTSSVEWMVRVWAETTNYFPVKEALTTEIKRQLDAHGLEIPFPQMQLHLKGQEHRADSASNLSQILPIPKLNSIVNEAARAPRVRPRARGENV